MTKTNCGASCLHTIQTSHAVPVGPKQKKSYHFPGNNAVGNALWRRNNLAFGHGGVYNENDRVCGYEQLEVICHGS